MDLDDGADEHQGGGPRGRGGRGRGRGRRRRLNNGQWVGEDDVAMDDADGEAGGNMEGVDGEGGPGEGGPGGRVRRRVRRGRGGGRGQREEGSEVVPDAGAAYSMHDDRDAGGAGDAGGEGLGGGFRADAIDG